MKKYILLMLLLFVPLKTVQSEEIASGKYLNIVISMANLSSKCLRETSKYHTLDQPYCLAFHRILLDYGKYEEAEVLKGATEQEVFSILMFMSFVKFNMMQIRSNI